MRSPEAPVIVDPGIGGGHPYYGIVLRRELQKGGIEPQWVTAKEVASDTLAKFYWRAVDFAYKLGGKGGMFTAGYEKIREGSKRGNRILRHAQEELGRYLEQYHGVIVATHAHAAVKTEQPLVLIQGDVHGGNDYAVPEADCIVVPTNVSKNELSGLGIPEEKIQVVGFFVDKAIKDPAIVQKRREQLASGNVHVGIFFTGALPRDHVRLARETLLPNLAHLMRKKQVKVSLYTFTDRALGEAFLRQGKELGVTGIRFDDDAQYGNWDMQVISGSNAQDGNEKLLSVVGNPHHPVGMMVTMIGERFAWAVGIPLFPFPPINRTNAGGNTAWGIEHDIFPEIAQTPRIDEVFMNRDLTKLKHRLLRAQELLPTEGAENTVKIVRNFLS